MDKQEKRYTPAPIDLKGNPFNRMQQEMEFMRDTCFGLNITTRQSEDIERVWLASAMTMMRIVSQIAETYPEEMATVVLDDFYQKISKRAFGTTE